MASITIKHVLQLEGGRWNLKSWTSAAVDMSEKVFVYQTMPDMPYQTLNSSKFVNIASAADMADYPEDMAGGEFPFFRKAGSDLNFVSLTMAENAVEGITADADALAASLTALNVFL